jgi:hypothetical protein
MGRLVQQGAQQAWRRAGVAQQQQASEIDTQALTLSRHLIAQVFS